MKTKHPETTEGQNTSWVLRAGQAGKNTDGQATKIGTCGLGVFHQHVPSNLKKKRAKKYAHVTLRCKGDK